MILNSLGGEIFMQAYDACRLIAVNLFSFVENPFTKDAYFNFDKFYKINYEAMRLSDDLIDLELEHIDRILEKIKSDPESYDVKEREWDLWTKIKNTASSSRRAGLGFTALADTLAALGLKYDSDEALKSVEEIMHTKMESELDCTIDLAILRGPFEGADPEMEFGVNISDPSNSWYEFLINNFPEQAKRMYKYSRRNVSFSTVAPTGTVSLLTQTTSGIEPLFMPFYMRRKKINSDSERVDFVDELGDKWQEFSVLHPKFKDWISTTTDYTEQVESGIITSVEELNKATLQSLFEQSPLYGSTANDIDWTKRVEMQGIIQKYTTHSISSTINLPSTVSPEEVSTIYMEAYKKGLKGITVYRDGSRSGVLVSDTNKTRDEFAYVNAVKRPKELKCHVHITNVYGKKYNIFVGMLNDKPYEVFVTDYFMKEGEYVLKKIKKGRYDLMTINGEVYSEDITTEMTDQQEAITRLVSTSLRHRSDIKFIVEQLLKTNGGISSFTKGLARVLKKYIPEGVRSTLNCNECGSKDVIFEEGCNKCLNCGSSACS